MLLVVLYNIELRHQNILALPGVDFALYVTSNREFIRLFQICLKWLKHVFLSILEPWPPDIRRSFLLRFLLLPWKFWKHVFSKVQVDDEVFAVCSFNFRVVDEQFVVTWFEITCIDKPFLIIQFLIKIRQINALDLHQLILHAHISQYLLPPVELWFYVEFLQQIIRFRLQKIQQVFMN